MSLHFDCFLEKKMVSRLMMNYFLPLGLWKKIVWLIQIPFHSDILGNLDIIRTHDTKHYLLWKNCLKEYNKKYIKEYDEEYYEKYEAKIQEEAKKALQSNTNLILFYEQKHSYFCYIDVLSHPKLFVENMIFFYDQHILNVVDKLLKPLLSILSPRPHCDQWCYMSRFDKSKITKQNIFREYTKFGLIPDKWSLLFTNELKNEPHHEILNHMMGDWNQFRFLDEMLLLNDDWTFNKTQIQVFVNTPIKKSLENLYGNRKLKPEIYNQKLKWVQQQYDMLEKMLEFDKPIFNYLLGNKKHEFENFMDIIATTDGNEHNIFLENSDYYYFLHWEGS